MLLIRCEIFCLLRSDFTTGDHKRGAFVRGLQLSDVFCYISLFVIVFFLNLLIYDFFLKFFSFYNT